VGTLFIILGITFTDPAQYLAIAERYISLLKPDIVVVNFFMGNDIFYFKRIPMPYNPPVFYTTNAGFINGCPDGIYFHSAMEAYTFVYDNYRIPAEDNLFNSFCSKTAIGTLLWKALKTKGYVTTSLNKYKEYYKKAEAMKTKNPYSRVQIDSIKYIAERNNCNFLLIAIPNLQQHTNVLRSAGDVEGLFNGLNYYVPKVTIQDYSAEDGHYNDKGHKKHADLQTRWLEECKVMGENPYISVVVAARNDNYGGDFNSRLQDCINWFAYYADQFHILSEFIIVDYNPIPESKQLVDCINFPVSKHVKFKVHTCSSAFSRKNFR
jgi:hypothetical protein